MERIKIKKGLNLPLSGAPQQIATQGNEPARIAILGDDYIGLKPAFEASIGDRVKTGQVLFTDRKTPNVKYTSPGSGIISKINRGARRHFLSIVLELEGNQELTFKSIQKSRLQSLSRSDIIDQLLDSGLWTALRARPFGKTANPETVPHSIFVTAMDSNPLAPSIEKILEGNEENFECGLIIISKLTDGTLHLCKAPGARMPSPSIKNLSETEFSGPHPSGNVGTHIHFLDPVGPKKTVWHIDAQDAAAVGALFLSGKLNFERIVSLAGPCVGKPRLIKTRIGACMESLTRDELTGHENRVISGSVLSGRAAVGSVAFLGRYHQQISVIPEGNKREFLGWAAPGIHKFSLNKVLLSGFLRNPSIDFDTSLNGDFRSLVPIGNYEKVMPLDLLPTPLFRSLLVHDIEEAEKLGCLELVEEDVSLCSFVCPSKIDYGPILRDALTTLEKEG